MEPRNIPLYFFSNLRIETASGRILDQYTCVQVNKSDEMPDRAIEWATENLRGFESMGYDPMGKEIIWVFDLPETWEPCPALLVCERLKTGREMLIQRFRQSVYGHNYLSAANTKWIQLVADKRNKDREFFILDNKLNLIQGTRNAFQITTHELVSVPLSNPEDIKVGEWVVSAYELMEV